MACVTRVYAGSVMKTAAASKIIAGVLPVILSLATLRAAETVAWPDLPWRIGDKERGYSVITKSGAIFRGRTLLFTSTDVRLTQSGPAIPREQVVEIRIDRHEPWKDALLAPAYEVIGRTPFILFFFVDNPVVNILGWIPTAGVIAATAPAVAATEGVRRLLPPKVIKVTP
jgi:hypothetical protein